MAAETATPAPPTQEKASPQPEAPKSAEKTGGTTQNDQETKKQASGLVEGIKNKTLKATDTLKTLAQKGMSGFKDKLQTVPKLDVTDIGNSDEGIIIQETMKGFTQGKLNETPSPEGILINNDLSGISQEAGQNKTKQTPDTDLQVPKTPDAPPEAPDINFKDAMKQIGGHAKLAEVFAQQPQTPTTEEKPNLQTEQPQSENKSPISGSVAEQIKQQQQRIAEQNLKPNTDEVNKIATRPDTSLQAEVVNQEPNQLTDSKAAETPQSPQTEQAESIPPTENNIREQKSQEQNTRPTTNVERSTPPTENQEPPTETPEQKQEREKQEMIANGIKIGAKLKEYGLPDDQIGILAESFAKLPLSDIKDLSQKLQTTEGLKQLDQQREQLENKYDQKQETNEEAEKKKNLLLEILKLLLAAPIIAATIAIKETSTAAIDAVKKNQAA